MGLVTCDVVSVDVVALRPFWQCVDGATSHCYEAEKKTAFTLHEVCLDVARLGHLPKHLVLSGGWHEVLPFSEVCRACLCPHSWEIKVTATLDIVMPFCVLVDSHWQRACCYGGAWE